MAPNVPMFRRVGETLAVSLPPPLHFTTPNVRQSQRVGETLAVSLPSLPSLLQSPRNLSNPCPALCNLPAISPIPVPFPYMLRGHENPCGLPVPLPCIRISALPCISFL